MDLSAAASTAPDRCGVDERAGPRFRERAEESDCELLDLGTAGTPDNVHIVINVATPRCLETSTSSSVRLPVQASASAFCPSPPVRCGAVVPWCKGSVVRWCEGSNGSHREPPNHRTPNHRTPNHRTPNHRTTAPPRARYAVIRGRDCMTPASGMCTHAGRLFSSYANSYSALSST